MKVFVVVYGTEYDPGAKVDSVYHDKESAEKRSYALEHDDLFDVDGDEIIAEWAEVTEIEVK